MFSSRPSFDAELRSDFDDESAHHVHFWDFEDFRDGECEGKSQTSTYRAFGEGYGDGRLQRLYEQYELSDCHTAERGNESLQAHRDDFHEAEASDAMFQDRRHDEELEGVVDEVRGGNAKESKDIGLAEHAVEGDLDRAEPAAHHREGHELPQACEHSIEEHLPRIERKADHPNLQNVGDPVDRFLVECTSFEYLDDGHAQDEHEACERNDEKERAPQAPGSERTQRREIASGHRFAHFRQKRGRYRNGDHAIGKLIPHPRVSECRGAFVSRLEGKRIAA